MWGLLSQDRRRKFFQFSPPSSTPKSVGGVNAVGNGEGKVAIGHEESNDGFLVVVRSKELKAVGATGLEKEETSVSPKKQYAKKKT